MGEDYLFPPLTVAEAEEIVQTLERAMNAHRHWIKSFQTMLVCRDAPDPIDLEDDAHQRVEFGRWYHNEPNEYLSRNPDFRAVGTHHRKMHDLARPLAWAIRDGTDIDAADYRTFLQGLETFKESVRTLLAEAWELLRFTDPLTGAANRFAMLPRLEQERQRLIRTGHSCSVCMVDLDRFKEINDTYGHQAGDAVLRVIARYLIDNVRKYDQLCRYGGEEFLIMLPDTAPKDAWVGLDRLRHGLRRQPIHMDGGHILHVTASLGIAALLPDHEVLVAIDHADQAMYEAKSAGRNQVSIWEEDLNSGTSLARQKN